MFVFNSNCNCNHHDCKKKYENKKYKNYLWGVAKQILHVLAAGVVKLAYNSERGNPIISPQTMQYSWVVALMSLADLLKRCKIRLAGLYHVYQSRLLEFSKKEMKYTVYTMCPYITSCVGLLKSVWKNAFNVHIHRLQLHSCLYTMIGLFCAYSYR